MYQLNPTILQTPVADGNILLLEPGSGLYFELNATSVDIFHGLINGQSVQQITDFILESYEVDKAQVINDIENLIEQFLRENIIQKKTSR